jgi:hypothetical protein
VNGTDPPPGPAPAGLLAKIQECIVRIEHDLMVTAGRTTRCRVTGPDENGGYWVGDGPMALFTPGQDTEAFVTGLADQLSEAISEDLADDGQIDLARTWPPCPFHKHALDPALINGQATWRCRDGAYNVRIGSFPGS